jgi:transcriptional regulator with XRE-family HTH domain
LRQLRADRGLTQRALGVLAGLTGPEISFLERGMVRAHPATVVKLSMALGIGAYRMRDILEASRDGAEAPASDTSDGAA